MAVPALNKCTLQRPAQEHGATAAAQIAMLDRNKTGAARIIAQHGFSKAGRDKYEAPDGSWIQWNSDRNTWERGLGTVHFQGLPQKISALAAQRYDAMANGLQAIAALPKLSAADLTASTAALTKAGFAAVLPNYFSHSDGSWVAFVGGKMLVGVDGDRLTGCPRPGSAPPPPPASSKCPRFTDATLPKKWDEWRRRFAVAKLPRAEYDVFTAAELTKILKHLGFKSTGRGHWAHPDGSQVTTKGRNIAGSKFQRWGFADFPYSNAENSGRWTQDTDDWQAWARGQRDSPPHGPV